ncbi:MAG: ABC transporter ATP-binding protein [Clostridia bacterium]|nr:ABC transporter ATP-binding protein [Clostridia bacterium]
MEVLNSKVKLEIIDLCKKFDDNKERTLENVSFTVYDGEFLSILGPSGCGKTTILRILIGLLKATSGKVLMEGRDITDLPPAARGMGIVFQNYALFENMTVLENVSYALKIKKETRADADKKALEMLEIMGLGEHVKKKPSELSGGQMQRVAIARTLVLNPKIILFDEPMSALDVETRITLRCEIKEIQKKFGTTMIYITHDQEEAFAMSDRIMIMHNAKVIQIDTPENIVKSPANDYVKSFVIDNLWAKFDSIKRYVRD